MLELTIVPRNRPPRMFWGRVLGVLRGYRVDMICVRESLPLHARAREPAVTPFCIVDEGALKAAHFELGAVSRFFSRL